MSQTPSDAIIIGAGHNSLACAVHLLSKGWRVEIHEQAAVPGGAIKTQELTLPGFRHDWAAMNLSLFAGSAFFQRYNKDLQRHGFEFAPSSNPFASSFLDGSWMGITNNADDNLERISQLSANDGATWRQLSDEFPARAEHILQVLGSPMNLGAIAALTLRTLRKAGLKDSQELTRFLLSSPRVWLDETFESDQLKATLVAWGMHLDFAPDIAGGAVFPYLEAMAAQAFGMVLGKGGADTVIIALQAMIREMGGQIYCNSPVKRILHDKARATGVELADGRHVSARKAVIANVAPAALAHLTGDGFDQKFSKQMRRFRHAPGTMMIHLAMDDLPDWTAGDKLRDFAYVHLAPSMDQMARTYQQAQAGLLPDTPVIVCGQPTVVDPSRAPKGKHILWLQVRMVPSVICGDAKGEITETDWKTAAAPFAQRALDLLEQHAPGTKNKILGRHIVGPLDLEADNPNLVGGDQVCGSHHLSQHFMFRPARGHADGTTPIKNLHLTGAAVWPGAGTGAGPGFMLAQKLAGK